MKTGMTICCDIKRSHGAGGINFLPLLLAVALCAPVAVMAFEKLTNCRWVDHAGNDGDSFMVRTGEKQMLVRLYFVDCPETTVATDADAKRVREQARYFGVTDPAKVIAFGREALAFTKSVLDKPFIVHTTYANALGRSAGGRVYAFVTTHDGKDLASLLVENGWARAFGAKRSTPDGVSADVMQQRLTDLELQAMLMRTGVWSATDPNEIARLREMQRKEDRELRELRESITGVSRVNYPVDLNTASASELQSISGIGTSLATAIMNGRPYKSVDDLLKVKGIGPRLLTKIRPYVTVTEARQYDPDHAPDQ